MICGVIVSFSALSYAALASIFPEDGGGYLYAKPSCTDIILTIATIFFIEF